MVFATGEEKTLKKAKIFLAINTNTYIFFIVLGGTAALR